MKKTDEIVWEDLSQMVSTARCCNTSNNKFMDFDKFLSELICFGIVKGSAWGNSFFMKKTKMVRD